MRDIEIKEIRIDDESRLCLSLHSDDPADYEFIYRAASGVSWDRESHTLCSGIPRTASYAEWFAIIRNAVAGEYGEQMSVTKRTIWMNIGTDTKSEIFEICTQPAV